MKLADFADREPRFVLETFFSGTLRGWGVTIGRLGGLQNRFTVDARGRFDPGTKVLTLREDYFFDDGHSDTLSWTIRKREDNRYEGHETLIDGVAEGEQAGSAFRWQYARDVPQACPAKPGARAPAATIQGPARHRTGPLAFLDEPPPARQHI